MENKYWICQTSEKKICKENIPKPFANQITGRIDFKKKKNPDEESLLHLMPTPIQYVDVVNKFL